MKMKAVILEKYGTPDVLKVGETARPIPKPNEILVKVQAASLNALDKHLSSGIILARPSIGLFKPKHHILGSDLAGIVVSVGEQVTLFKPGDRVFGGRTWGAFAQYACLEEQKAAIVPEGVTYQQAAALPVAAGTALQALRHGQVQSGQQVLINGASGGVGTYTVQLAKHFGAHVTAVCSGANVSLISALGADRVIDYNKAPVTELHEAFDLVIDNVGNLDIRDYKRLTHAQGNVVIVGFSAAGKLIGHLIKGRFASSKNGRKIGLLDTKVNHQDLTCLVDLLVSRDLRSIIDREYPITAIKEAMEYLWTRRVKGKLVLTMG